MSHHKHTPHSGAAPTPEAHGNRDARAGALPASSQPAPAQDSAALNEHLAPNALHFAKAAIEALLLASSAPLSRQTLADCLPEEARPLINGALEALRLDYQGPARGIHLVEVAGGFQLRTNPDFRESVKRMFQATPRKLSRAALEALAIVAYRQPLTRAEVDEIRGVDSAGVLRTLEEHDLIHTIGRLDDLGRPHIWGTTPRFLEFFGLDSLSDLPTLSESELQALDELYAEELAQADDAPPPP